jgi:hypothetical protein
MGEMTDDLFETLCDNWETFEEAQQETLVGALPHETTEPKLDSVVGVVHTNLDSRPLWPSDHGWLLNIDK